MKERVQGNATLTMLKYDQDRNGSLSLAEFLRLYTDVFINQAPEDAVKLVGMEVGKRAAGAMTHMAMPMYVHWHM